MSFFFLQENLTITQSFRLILWHVSRSLGERRVPVRDKAWYTDYPSSCMSWMSSGTGFTSIISLRRYCEESKAFLCNVAICLERIFVQFFDISSSDSTRTYLSRNSSNLEARFASPSWIEFTVSNSSISSTLLSFSSCFFVRTSI